VIKREVEIDKNIFIFDKKTKRDIVRDANKNIHIKRRWMYREQRDRNIKKRITERERMKKWGFARQTPTEAIFYHMQAPT
jgi:hypothetical protein